MGVWAMMQGDQYSIPIKVTGFTKSDVSKIVFAIGNVLNTDPGDVTFTDADSTFQVPVTRAETLDMTGRQFCFEEVFFENGNNIGCPIGNIDVSDIKTRGVFDAEI